MERVLFDILTKDAAAVAASKAPNKKGGGKKDIAKLDYDNQWSLSDPGRMHLILQP